MPEIEIHRRQPEIVLEGYVVKHIWNEENININMCEGKLLTSFTT